MKHFPPNKKTTLSQNKRNTLPPNKQTTLSQLKINKTLYLQILKLRLRPGFFSRIVRYSRLWILHFKWRIKFTFLTISSATLRSASKSRFLKAEVEEGVEEDRGNDEVASSVAAIRRTSRNATRPVARLSVKSQNTMSSMSYDADLCRHILLPTYTTKRDELPQSQ